MDAETDAETESEQIARARAPTDSRAADRSSSGWITGVQPITRRALHQQVADSLRELILDGKIQRGEALPPERVLAKQFGVSRATVREALRALQLWGLVEARQGGGNYACTPSIEHITIPLSAIIERNRQLQDELMDARLIVEPAICWLAAQRRTQSDLDTIDAILARQCRRVEQGDVAVEEDTAFHLALAEATHNQVVPRLIATINDLLLESRLRSLRTPDRPRRSLEGHLRIAAALRAGDAEAARQAMHDHVAEIATILRAARLPSS